MQECSEVKKIDRRVDDLKKIIDQNFSKMGMGGGTLRRQNTPDLMKSDFSLS